jgi:hypothetical protein
MTTPSFFEWCRLRRGKWQAIGRTFDSSDLAGKFIEHFMEPYRIEVQQYGMRFRGYVRATTGWKPAFILVFNRRALGSSVVLQQTVEITRIFPKVRQR